MATTKAQAFFIAIAAGLILLLLGLSAWLFLSGSPAPQRTADAVPEPPAADFPATQPAAPSVGPKIKVGVLLSHYTATVPTVRGGTYRYRYVAQRSILDVLHDPELDFYPIIEPGTENLGQLPQLLQDDFPGKQPLSAASAADLRQLHVIVATSQWNMRAEVPRAIAAAVQNGVGLFQRDLGVFDPGLTSELCHLAGMEDGAQFTMTPDVVECVIVGDHPLLGNLAGQQGRHLWVTPNGIYGQLRGIPLVAVVNPQDVGVDRTGQSLSFYPVYISQLGKGRIVGVQIRAFPNGLSDLDNATGGRFYDRCIKWLADRPLD